MKRTPLLLCIMLLFALSHAAGEPADRNADEALIGSVAPDFVLPDLKGKSMRLQEWRGQWVMLNFWAFWCDTWKAEMPHLKELATQQDEMEFRMIAISVDGARLREFLRRVKGELPFPTLLDGGGKVSAQYRIAHVPTVMLIDPKGRIRYVKSGYPGNHVILAALRRLRNPSKPPPPDTTNPLSIRPAQP